MDMMKRQLDGSVSGGGGGSAIVVSKRARVGGDDTKIVEYKKHRGSDGGVERLSSLPAPTMQLVGHESEVNALEFSPSGTLLASGSFDRTLVLWSIESTSCDAIAVMRGHKSSVTDVKWLCDGETIVTASADKTAALWDSVTTERIKQMKGHTSFVNAASVAPRDMNEPWKIATASDDRTVKVWDRRIKGRNSSLTLEHMYQVLAVTFGANEHTLYSGGLDNDVHTWDLRKAEKETMKLKGHENTITGLAVNPKGTHLVSNAMDHTCRIWDIRPFVEGGDEHRLTRTLHGHRHQVEKNLIRCRFAPNGRTVAAGSGDRMVWVWDGMTGEVLYKLPGHRGCVNDVSFHPTEPIIGSASSDKIIYLGEIKM